MSDIALISGGQPLVSHLEGRCDGHTPRSRRTRGTDACEVIDSPTAAELARWQRGLQQCDGVRWGLVDQVRASIARGEYMTDDRIDQATQHLARELEH